MAPRPIHPLRPAWLTVVLAAVLALAATVLVAGAPPAAGSTFTVTSGAASGPGTWFQALDDASQDTSGPHVIEVDPGLTITPGVAFPGAYDGGQPLTINGNGAVVDLGGQAQRGLRLNTAAAVEVNDLTIRNSAATFAGAVQVLGTGDVTLDGVTAFNHQVTSSGGAIRSTDAASTLTIRNSIFEQNNSDDIGGAVLVNGPLVVSDTVFENNNGTTGGAIYATNTVTVDRSLFLDNDADFGGGALYSGNQVATTVRNSTFVGNQLNGASNQGSAIRDVGDLTVDHSWFEGNTGTQVGTAQVRFDIPAVANTITNTVLVGPGATGIDCSTAGTHVTGYTVSSDDSCFPGGLAEGDVEEFAGDLRMGPLRDNGGVVPTKFPLAGSPVLDGGPAAGPTSNCSLADDARSVARPFPSGATHCDLGPVEATYPPSTLSDVPAWAADAIAWITSSVNDPRLMEGFGNNTFRPADPITRGQVVRMLYRLMGEPDVTGLTHPFTDVPNWVEPAVLWAYNEGGPDDRIVTGVTATKFKPADPITRGQVVRMLYRTVGSPDITGMPPHPFSDVPNWVEEAVTWAANTDNPLPLFTGITATRFKPSDDITRAQVARSSYRMAITPEVWDVPAVDTVPFVAPIS